MYTARFLYNIYEEKYAINPYYSWGYSEDWHVKECGEFSLGYKDQNVMRYVKIKERDAIFYEENIKIMFEPKNEVKINNEIIKIIRVVKNLDGSIDYYTDKKEYISMNTRSTYFDERPPQEKEIINEYIKEKQSTLVNKLFPKRNKN